jgi:hypothetical protein
MNCNEIFFPSSYYIISFLFSSPNIPFKHLLSDPVNLVYNIPFPRKGVFIKLRYCLLSYPEPKQKIQEATMIKVYILSKSHILRQAIWSINLKLVFD